MLLAILFSLVIWAVIFYVLWWGLGQIAIGEPWHKICVVILVLATVYVIIGLLMGSIAPFPFLGKF